MDQLLGMCGIVCSECDAFQATQKDDNDKRTLVAQNWSKMFDADLKVEDINCEGCMSGSGIVFNYCSSCEIRACGVEKGLKTCAPCSDYPCDRLTEFHKVAPDAKTVLDGIRETL